jgi:hypothetical protein
MDRPDTRRASRSELQHDATSLGGSRGRQSRRPRITTISLERVLDVLLDQRTIDGLAFSVGALVVVAIYAGGA